MKFKLSFFLSLFLLLVPTALFAAEFKAIVGIPGVTENITGTTGLNLYINALYRLSISIAALLAVIKIVAAGAKYMLSDIITHKEEAKKDIQGALVGLLIVIAAVIILNTVNSDLTRVNFNLEPLEAPTPTAPITTPVDPTVALCNDPGLGGCTRYSCETLMTDIVSYASVGCALGATVGGVNGGIVGSSVPVLGNIVGFISGAGFGCVGGALIGGFTGSFTDDTFCSTGCSLAGGTYESNSNMCTIPNNSELFTKAQLENARVAIDNDRAADKLAVATASPINNTEMAGYFDVDSSYFNNLLAITNETEIVIADRGLVAARLGLSNPGELSDNLSRVTQTAVYKNIPFEQLQDPQSEYSRMLANAETQIRSSCSNGQVSKMQVTENTQTSLSNVSVLTRYYCIR